ncbi:uncharacterized protein KD926_001917 [Aspergillus affinis]|uniref:uncharacterized protein n=1 Tax=Aspergillus affinis TaxID=1070780 RepID=UPI0022FDC572|nr:uncharacterized protein KD926_001917 [Aspergillus affinis]KAI9044094.1 hypothetical protein KD926_001917 [Aspergillus affinis]
MPFCWGAKPDKDEFPYVLHYQDQPLRRSQRHGDHPAVGAQDSPAPVGLEHRAPSEPHGVPRPDRRRRDHATTDQPPVSQAIWRGSSSGSSSGSGSDSPVRESSYYTQYQRSNYSSFAESSSLTRGASPDIYDDILVSSSSISQEHVFVRQRQYSRPQHLPTGYRGEEDHEEARRSSAGYLYHPRPVHVDYSVRSLQSVPFGAVVLAAAPRPERRADQRVRFPADSGSGRGREREHVRSDSRPPRQADAPQSGQYDPDHADGDARPARPRQMRFEGSESRPRAGSLPRPRPRPRRPRPHPHPRPRPRLVDGHQQDDSVRRNGRQQIPLDQMFRLAVGDDDGYESDA